MELSWCKSLIAVVEHGGFLAAAKATNRAQSRISAHVAAVEKEAGARLLDRSIHPPTLTTAGLALLPHARAAVAEWEAALASAAWMTGRIHGTIAIGSIPSVSSQLLAPTIAEFGAKHSDVTFEIHEGPNSWLDDALAHRTVEISIRPMFEDRASLGVNRQQLFEDRLVVIVPRLHRLAGKRSVALADLSGEALISTGEAGFDPHLGSEFRELMADTPIDRRRSLAVSQPTTVFSFVRAGIGIGMIGSLAARMIDDRSLLSLPIEEPHAMRQIGLYWSRSRPLSAAAGEFMIALRATAEQFSYREPSESVATSRLVKGKGPSL